MAEELVDRLPCGEDRTRRLIQDLCGPDSGFSTSGKVAVRETHISVVLCSGADAFKIKKPVRYAYVDYSTPEQRHRYCLEEIRLNSRLSPEVYRGVVPVVMRGGRARLGGEGRRIDTAVRMVRLPEDRRLLDRVRRGRLDRFRLVDVARRIAAFHAKAARGRHISVHATLPKVRALFFSTLEAAAGEIGEAISREVHDRIVARAEAEMEQHGDLITDRADRDVPVEGHGDLRLEHIYDFPGRPEPRDLAIIDCIDFNEGLRCSDPVADVAFLYMDLVREGRSDLAHALEESYFQFSGDGEGRALLPLYSSYRAAVRGMVLMQKVRSGEMTPDRVNESIRRARTFWLLSLGFLEDPGNRPCLLVMAGLPGSGKSTLARSLARDQGLALIRSDVVRKELAGLQPPQATSYPYGQGLYSSGWTHRTYRECLRRADESLFRGKRVLMDAAFPSESHRLWFRDLAKRWAVPFRILYCVTRGETAVGRLSNRNDGFSDADGEIHHRMAERWDSFGPGTAPWTFELDTGAPPEGTAARAVLELERMGVGRKRPM